MSEVKSVRMESVAAGLWHTICISSDGKVYAFGGNQFGQLGTGTDHAEVSLIIKISRNFVPFMT